MERDSILVNEQAFQVSGRLKWALYRLWSTHVKRVFWIDAICINQNDNVEKSHQVGQMRAIYEKACQVLIYLGDGPNVCFAVIELLKSLAAVAKKRKVLTDEQDYDDASIARNIATLFPDLEAWEELFMFFIDEWWTRA
jgi:hypothetical protein